MRARFGALCWMPRVTTAGVIGDATAILLAYRHGLRASELVALRSLPPSSPASEIEKARWVGTWVPTHLTGRLLGLTRVVFFVDVGQTPGAVAVELQHRLLIRVDVVLHSGRHHEETARRQRIGLALVRTGAFS
jgi:hypothetical protein